MNIIISDWEMKHATHFQHLGLLLLIQAIFSYHMSTMKCFCQVMYPSSIVSTLAFYISHIQHPIQIPAYSLNEKTYYVSWTIFIYS